MLHEFGDGFYAHAFCYVRDGLDHDPVAFVFIHFTDEAAVGVPDPGVPGYGSFPLRKQPLVAL